MVRVSPGVGTYNSFADTHLRRPKGRPEHESEENKRDELTGNLLMGIQRTL